MRRHRSLLASLLVSLVTFGAACTGEPAPQASVTQGTAAGVSPSEAGHAITSAKDYDLATFETSTTVDNAWFPLVPGTRWTWEGHAFDDGERVRRRVVFTVTDLTKVIDGVEAVVAWDLDYNDDELAEAELAFFAQDGEGNVWHLGQYPEEYEGDEIVKTPTWLAGVGGARAGLAMKAEPALGTPSYAQGWGPQVGWNDRAQTHRMGVRTCVPVACYDDVLVTREFSQTEPGAFQLKYYATGVGNVRVGWGGPEEEEREVMVLVDLTSLDADALAEVREQVLAQERRAYRLSPDVYGTTAPSG